MQPIAVAIIHGIEIEDPDFAATPTKLLYEAFADAVGPDRPDPEKALVVEPVHWAPATQGRQKELFDQVFRTDSSAFFDQRLTNAVKKVNAGATWPLMPMALSTMRHTIDDLDELHLPTARWLMMHFIGDVIAYDRSAGATNYNAIHRALASALNRLARRAGPDAPLCVIAHSFGTVLASDYFYDQQHPRRKLAASVVNRSRGESPLAKGKTLAWMYTMGSPLALWSLRYPSGKKKMSQPIEFPAKHVLAAHPGLPTEWINILDKDDIIAYPLSVLSEEYAATVTEDRVVNVRWFPLSMTPLTHSYYWSDGDVMDPIGAALAAGWQHIN